MKITLNTGIHELLDKYPEIIPLLLSYGLHCVGCSFAKHDTLKQGAKIHGITGNELKMMLRDINKIIENETTTKNK